MAKLYVGSEGFPFMHGGSGGYEPLGVPLWLRKLVQLWRAYDEPEDRQLGSVLADVIDKRIEPSPARDRLITFFKEYA